MITKPIYIKDEWNCKILIRIIKIRAQLFYTKDWITVEKKLQHFNLHLSLSLSSKTWKILRFPEREKKKKEGKTRKLLAVPFAVMNRFHVDISHCFHDEIPQNFLSVLDFRRSFYLADTIAVYNATIIRLCYPTT